MDNWAMQAANASAKKIALIGSTSLPKIHEIPETTMDSCWGKTPEAIEFRSE
jgi:hypothetical protein